jgi:hypothetical protein
LFQHVRYHEVDILEFERQSAQHWMAILGEGERVPRAVNHPPKAEGDHPPADAAESKLQCISAKEIIEATGLPAHLFTDRIEQRSRAYWNLGCKSSSQSLNRTLRAVCCAGMSS